VSSLLTEKGFAKILDRPMGMPACPMKCEAYFIGAELIPPGWFSRILGHQDMDTSLPKNSLNLNFIVIDILFFLSDWYLIF